MYSAERRRDILRLIQENSSVSVDQLAVRFDVSTSSIRRDLNELHRLGLVQRTYGGAIVPTGSSSEPPFSVRVVSRHDEKDRIGKAAALLVQPGDTIFIDGGTTTHCMVSYLSPAAAERSNGAQRPERSEAKDGRITVVTYGLNIVQRLLDQEGITVILVGGILHAPTQTFGGVFASASLDAFNIRFDKAFMAASGVSSEAGITNAGFEEILIKRWAIRSARETILLADSSKIGVISAGVIAPIEQLQRLITTTEAPVQEIESLRRRGVIVDLV
jgi:DeoR/GlpR family transcriptional regulator of sugar metabolism